MAGPGDLFGPVITGRDVELALQATVETWSSTYIAEVSERSGRPRGDLSPFRSYATALDIDRFVEDQTPSCIFVCAGLVRAPVRHGRGQYEGAWAASVGCVVEGQTQDNTIELVQLYQAAVRALVIQHGSLGGFASETRWVGERYDHIPNAASRTIAAGSSMFEVVTFIATDAGLGPSSADATAEPPDLATIRTVAVTVEGRSQ